MENEKKYGEGLYPDYIMLDYEKDGQVKVIEMNGRLHGVADLEGRRNWWFKAQHIPTNGRPYPDLNKVEALGSTKEVKPQEAKPQVAKPKQAKPKVTQPIVAKPKPSGQGGYYRWISPRGVPAEKVGLFAWAFLLGATCYKLLKSSGFCDWLARLCFGS